MQKLVDQFMGRMTLDDKVGQLLCFGFCGTYPYPDIVDMIDRHRVAGFRVTPYARKFGRYFGPNHPGTPRISRPLQPRERTVGAGAPPTRLNAREYAALLNQLRQRSLERGAGVPLYFSLDWEGNGSADYLADNMHGVPHPMGLALAGDDALIRRAAWMVGRQMKAVGVDWVHSPDVDVNTDPANPEIGTRSAGPDIKACADYGLQTLLGYRDARFIATAKHFPGRGHSAADAHHGVPTIAESLARMRAIHLAAYQPMIAAGLPAIMLAHSVYPALDASGEISTLSRRIVTGVLREELGYRRVIITDSFTMGGLVARYDVDEAAIRAFEAGVDLILLKDENALRGEVFDALKGAVKSRRLSEARIDESVRRVLEVKAEYGLLDGNMGLVDLDEVDAILNDPENEQIAREADTRSVLILRNSGAIPLRMDARVAVFEEISGPMLRHNTSRLHGGMLYEALIERGVDAEYVDFTRKETEKPRDEMRQRANACDVIVCTGYYNRSDPERNPMHDWILELGKPVVFIGNSPYTNLVRPAMRDVIVHFNASGFTMNHIADVLLGRTNATIKLPFDPDRVY